MTLAYGKSNPQLNKTATKFCAAILLCMSSIRYKKNYSRLTKRFLKQILTYRGLQIRGVIPVDNGERKLHDETCTLTLGKRVNSLQAKVIRIKGRP